MSLSKKVLLSEGYYGDYAENTSVAESDLLMAVSYHHDALENVEFQNLTVIGFIQGENDSVEWHWL